MNGYALNSSNDLTLTSGSISRTDEGDQVVQHVRTRLLFYEGEWFLDTDAGIPYIQEVFIKPANIALTEGLIKAEITQTPGVEKLISFVSDFNKTTRTLTVDFEALTEFGEVSSQIHINQN